MSLDELTPDTVDPTPIRGKKKEVNGAADTPVVESLSDRHAAFHEAQEARDEERLKKITTLLDATLSPSLVRTRKGGGGKTLRYLTGKTIYQHLNKIFGYGRWSTTDLTIVDVGQGQDGMPKAVRATVELSVEFGEYRSAAFVGVGVKQVYGSGYETACKGAATDALKRASIALGNQFGLDLYPDKEDGDDVEDDGEETTTHTTPSVKKSSSRFYCEADGCSNEITGYTSKSGRTYTAEDIVNYSRKECDGHVYCGKHKKEYLDSQDA